MSSSRSAQIKDAFKQPDTSENQRPLDCTLPSKQGATSNKVTGPGEPDVYNGDIGSNTGVEMNFTNCNSLQPYDSSGGGSVPAHNSIGIDPTTGGVMDLLERSLSDLSMEPGDDIPLVLIAYGNFRCDQFSHSGAIEDINAAIESWGEAILRIPEPCIGKATIMSNQGNGYLSRFERLGQTSDLEKSIKCLTEALTYIPDGHESRPNVLCGLANSLRIRFIHQGEPQDLSRSIEYGTKAVSLTPDGHPDKPKFLNNLSNSHLNRFDRLGELLDLDRSTECGVQALLLLDDRHTDRPGTLTNLSNCSLTRFERLGELMDLNRAIDYLVEASVLIPESHADKSSTLNNLGISYLTRFGRLGQIVDLDNAIECIAEAVLHTPIEHIEKADGLCNLGIAYQTRFDRLGELPDISKAIEHGLQALTLSPDNHVLRPAILFNLGGAYWNRFKALGELMDLNKAIEYQTLAVSLTPGAHEKGPQRLSSLGSLFLSRFLHLNEMPDLLTAIGCGIKALLITPDGHASKPAIFDFLGCSCRLGYQHGGGMTDLDKAIDCGTQAALLTPPEDAQLPGRLNNLATSCCARFERLGTVEDLNMALECGKLAVSLIPDGHFSKPEVLNTLGYAYITRYANSAESSDLDSAVSCFKKAAQSTVGLANTKFNACCKWVQVASSFPAWSPLPAYQQAFELLPQLVWIGTTLDRRYRLITEISDFATEAASYAISINKYELALEWLEASRSIVWGQIAQLRAPFDQLSTQDSGLATRLREVSRKLEHVGFRASSMAPLEVKDTDLAEEANNHIQLALDWEALLAEARSIPGFENFLRPPESAKLLATARLHPVVIINVHTSRCDALILRPNSSVISHIRLAELSVTSVMATRKHLTSQVRHRQLGHLIGMGPLEKSLKDLWTSVVHPVLTSLGYTSKLPIEKLPRLTWCTTGLLSFLPLHAAGSYDGVQPNAMDLVISSYTPTLSALIARQSVMPDTQCGILAVGQEHTPGLASLPYTKDELAVVQKHAREGCYLQLENEEATSEEVMDAMDEFSWLHMACHGSQDTIDPTQSAFHLHDGRLALSTITKKMFTNKGLAFLSACQTATGDKDLPEEAVHLAAGMLMAGFPSVIGTMWSIADEDGPQVADRVYASLLKDGKMDHTNAARALHEAIVELRTTVGERSFERWAPFIHIGC